MNITKESVCPTSLREGSPAQGNNSQRPATIQTAGQAYISEGAVDADPPVMKPVPLWRRVAASLVKTLAWGGLALTGSYITGQAYIMYMETHRDDDFPDDPYLTFWGRSAQITWACILGGIALTYWKAEKLMGRAVEYAFGTNKLNNYLEHANGLEAYNSVMIESLNKQYEELHQRVLTQKAHGWKVSISTSGR